jgi:hypothetical protein
MIAAFVGAEFDSTRFGPAYRRKLLERGGNESIVRNPNLALPNENRVRHGLLEDVRGYPATLLFTGFPDDVHWIVAELSIAELGECLYANHETWRQLSSGTRLVKDGAANIETIAVTEEINGENISVNKRIKAIAAAIENGAEPLPLIAVSTRSAPPLVIAEGHSRATAHVIAAATTGRATIQAQLGMSRRMSKWAFW